MNVGPSSRLAQLEALLSESPNDPFLLYGIALEMAKIHPDDGLAKLRELTHIQPEYLPTYYRLADLLIEQGRESEANTFIVTGIHLAKVQNNKLALKELETLLSIANDD
jgi:tetratricopeptide (TPR) repeat protein